ncbi:MAG: hypothetical protein ACLQGP_13265 [Isosphaeraceae bacterium]
MSSSIWSRGTFPSLRALAASLPGSRYVPPIVAALAILLALPSLGTGLHIDDYYHRTILRPGSPHRDLLGPPAEMFRFFRGDPARTVRIMDIGAFPWWTDPTLKAEFLQALTVLTHRLDYALWPDSPALMHAQSLFWLGTAVAAAAAFYHRMLGPKWVSVVAALLFAVDDARGTTVGFIANRNVLIAATFGLSALVCHDRWRRGGSRPSAFLAVCLLALALFSKEEGIGTCAYLAAYALFADPKGLRSGCLAMLPYAGLVVGWRALRGSWGYGVHNVGLYVDPLTDPGPFASAVADRVPLLLFGQWGPIPAETAVVLRPPLANVFWWTAVVFIGLLIIAVAPLLKQNRLARFWAAGMLFACIPVCATLPMDRLLTFVGIGPFGLLAQFWAFVFDRSGGAPSNPRWRIPARALAWFFVAVHAVGAPLAFPLRATSPLGPWWVEDRLYVRAPLGPEIGGKTLVIVNAPSVAHAGYLTFREAENGGLIPRLTRVLAPAVPGVSIRRLDEHTLEIKPRWGYLQMVLDRVFRSERRPMAPGEEVRLTGMTARVTAITADGRPAVATFRFDEPLESPSFVWLCFRGDRFEPFELPAVGLETEIRFDWRTVFTPPGPGRNGTGSR